MKLGDITADVIANTKPYELGMNKVASVTAEATVDTNKSIESVGTVLGGIKTIALTVGTAVVGAFSLITKQGISVSAELESARAGFIALLGSAEEADAVLERIKKEAKATPFEMTGLTTGVQALTAITKNGQKAIDILMDVGKAVSVSGKGQAELDRVIFNLQQISATGKVTEMDIRQFQSAIPVFNDILTLSGLTTEELKDSANSAELLFNAFQKYGSEGIGAEGFISQAGTWNQLISNLKDTWNIFTADFVQQTGVFDLAKDILKRLIDFIEINTPKIIQFIENIRGNFDGFMQSSFMTTAIQIFETIWTAVSAGANDFYLIMKEVFAFIVEWWNMYLKPAFEELWSVLAEVFGDGSNDAIAFKDIIVTVARVIAYALGGIVIGLTVLITAIVRVISWGLEMQNKIQGFVENIKNAFLALPKVVELTWGMLVKKLQDFSGKILNAITKPFTDAYASVSKIAEKIKQSLDKINPFHRESPSLIDNITKGVDTIKNEYGKLGNLAFNAVSGGLESGGLASTGMAINIDMTGANISSPEVAREYAESIGNTIIDKLRITRRSYG